MTITLAHSGRRHAGWYTRTAWSVAGTVVSCVALGVVSGVILALAVVGPILHGMGL